MAGRKEFVKAMTDIFGPGYFVYAGFKKRPDKLPHGLYLESPGIYLRADDSTYLKVRAYIVRCVSEDKDWDLEDTIEDSFDDMGIWYQKITDEPFADEKVHVVEWEIQLIDDRKKSNG